MEENLYLLRPEICLIVGACLALLVNAFPKTQNSLRKGFWISYLLSQMALLVSLAWTLQLFRIPSAIDFVNHALIVDRTGSFLKILILTMTSVVLIYARKYLEERQQYEGEYFVLSLFSVVGMMVLVASHTLLSLYLGLELFALPLYALIALSRSEVASSEASMKYFVMGALASGMLLYGISLLYGITGSIEIKTIAEQLSQSGTSPNFAILTGLIFLLVGIGFKFGAVPFHMWVPDVYQGAPTAVTLFIGTLPKLAGFGMAVRILVDTVLPLHVQAEQLLMIMAVLSLAIGNIGAIAQTNLKRMLGYSAIAHVGFIFLGLLAGFQAGFGPTLFYILIYVFMVLAAFGIMIALSRKGFEFQNISDFEGLGQRRPWIAFLMLLTLFSFAGLPPTAGFYAKFLVLTALIKAGFVWLAVVAVIFTVVGAYYYLRVVRVMFFQNPNPELISSPISNAGQALLSLNGLTLLFFGIFPGPLVSLCLNLLKP